jgi:hypothetical protein
MSVPTIAPRQVLAEARKNEQCGNRTFTRRTTFPCTDPLWTIEVHEVVVDGRVFRQWLAVSRVDRDGCQIIDGPEAEQALQALGFEAQS